MAFAISSLTLVILVVSALAIHACPDVCVCEPFKKNAIYLAVDCSGRNLNDIPSNIPANTKSLNMANNNLIGFVAASLADTAIEELNLENNQIQSSTSLEFRKLALKELNLKGNQLTRISGNTFNMQGDWSLEDFIYYRLPRVVSGHWHIRNVSDVKWPCLIDLRNNPISLVETIAFSGSKNFTIFLGDSSTDLIIEQAAFGGTENVHGIHITHVPHLTLDPGAFDGISKIGWIIIDNTDMSLAEHLFSFPHDTAQLRWLRLSNSNIRQLTDKTLEMTMNVKTSCVVKTFPYKYGGTIHYSTSTIHMGGIEIVNNTLPVLPVNLIKNTHLGGIYFSGNHIAGFASGVFSRDARQAEVCIIRFSDNQFSTISSGAFGGVHNVAHLNIATKNLTAIEADAFMDSRHIGIVGIGLGDNSPTEHTTVKSKAFRGLQDVKLFGIDLGNGEWGSHILLNQTGKITIEAFAFDGLRNVEYMTLNLYDYMHVLPNNFFTGVKVNQLFKLYPNNLTRVHQNAFGENTSIEYLDVYHSYIPCDCETAKMNTNLKRHVRAMTGLQCTAPFEDGTISHAWGLDHATCGTCKLGHKIIIISFILVYFMKM